MKSIKILSLDGGWVCNSRQIHSLKQSGLFEITGIVSNDPDEGCRVIELMHEVVAKAEHY